MGPVRGSERVVDIDVGHRRELDGVRRIVLFLTRVEAQVLEQDDFGSAVRPAALDCARARKAGLYRSIELHRLVEKLAQPGGDSLQRVLRVRFPLGTPE